MTYTESYTEYGVFVWHGSAQMLHKTFRKAESVDIWRRCNRDVEIASVMTRPMTVQYGDWAELYEGHAEFSGGYHYPRARPSHPLTECNRMGCGPRL